MIRSDSLVRVTLTLVFTYLFSLGATWNGVLIPEVSLFTVGLLTALFIVWIVIRWRGKWAWHSTPLDKAFLLWGAAFLISLLANNDSWRRTFIGLWYVGVYIGVWFVLHDLIANRLLQRDTLVDAFLFGSIIVVFFGYVQLNSTEFNLTSLDFPRPGSLIGNPNSFGGFLVVLIGLTIGRFLSVKNKLGRVTLGIYCALNVILLFLTFSRGAWLGFLGGLITLAALGLSERDLLSIVRFRQGWGVLSSRIRSVLVVSVIVITVITGLMAVLFVHSFNESGRSLSLRTEIYEDALTIFADKPFTGHGLFTFGQEFARQQSQPPRQPHSHPHNILLLVADEEGVVGLVAVGWTLFILVSAMRRNWRDSLSRNKPLMTGALMAVFGFGIHHLTDTPAMMPVIALIGLISLVLATVESSPMTITNSARSIGQTATLSALWIVLIATGFWSSLVYADYNTALKYALSGEHQGEYREAAVLMQSAVDADPNLALYHSQQGYLYGLAANEGDESALNPALTVDERFVQLEPQNAVGWVNLAALYAQSNRLDDAITAQQTGLELAPSAWQLWFGLGLYAEANADESLAQESYKRALNNASQFHPAWENTPLRSAIANSAFAMAALRGSVRALTNPPKIATDDVHLLSRSIPGIREFITSIILAPHATEDFDQLANLLERAELLVEDDEDQAWIDLGRADIARRVGDNSMFLSELQAARDLIAPDLLEEDYQFGTNIAHFQFLRFTIPRQFLPQVFYPTADPLLLRFLNEPYLNGE
jgi:putative inorganic carbon (HCO3(-)) transporter